MNGTLMFLGRCNGSGPAMEITIDQMTNETCIINFSSFKQNIIHIVKTIGAALNFEWPKGTNRWVKVKSGYAMDFYTF